LWIAVQFESDKKCKAVVDHCIEEGVLSDWFLFSPNCLRISPPLSITTLQIERASQIILQAV
jgi:acetylornithine/succinyldiaminopimelate/putrescine aminotransferase